MEKQLMKKSGKFIKKSGKKCNFFDNDFISKYGHHMFYFHILSKDKSYQCYILYK